MGIESLEGVLMRLFNKNLRDIVMRGPLTSLGEKK